MASSANPDLPSAAVPDWSNLAIDLLVIILGHLHTLQDFYTFRAVCQNWRSAASPSPSTLASQSPLLVLNILHFGGLYDIVSRRLYSIRLPFRTLAYSHRQLIAVKNRPSRYAIHPPDPTSSYIVLTDFFTHSRIYLPDHPHPFQRVLLSFRPVFGENCRCRVVLFTKNVDPSVVQYLDVGQFCWNVVSSPHLSFIRDMMFFQGELIALTSELELVVVELAGGCLIVRKFGNCGVIGVKEYCNTWLAELDGMILVVIQVNARMDTGGGVFLVIRWNSYKDEWEEIREFGDKALFVSVKGNAVFVSVAASGLRSNCVYWINSETPEWFVFHLKNSSVDTMQIDTRKWFLTWSSMKTDSYVWVL